MKPGVGSKTAVLVCMGRALADSDAALPQFRDPTAFTLLPDDARKRVEHVRSGAEPKGMVEAVKDGYLRRQAKVMAVRTIAIDDAVREAASPQLVILGAGLDGRAWRMTELSDVIVYDVDHPDSQRDKSARVGLLTHTARDVRFVPVDFARDDLDHALAGAGHDPARPTTWIWEGVVMYLERRAIEATLDIVSRRSAPGSRLIILYHRPALMLKIVGLVVRRLGEPLRSTFQPDAMRAMLAKHGFAVERDQSVHELGSAMSAALGEATNVTKHLRTVVARRT